MPLPSLVGRDDVADLAVVTALTKTSSSRRNPLRPHAGNSGSIVSGDTEAPPSRSANHWTWAVRWTGQHLSPPQGLRPYGCADAATCFDGAVKEQTALDRNRRTREKYLESYHGGRELLRLSRWRRKMKPCAQSISSLSIINYLSINLHKRGLRHRPSTRLPASILSHLCYFLQMPLHCTFVSLCDPKGLLSLLPLLCMYPDTENVFRKFLICQPGHPQFSWEHSICNPIVDIVFKMHFSWMIIPVWISSFSGRRSRKQLLLLRNRLVVEFYLRSQFI